MNIANKKVTKTIQRSMTDVYNEIMNDSFTIPKEHLVNNNEEIVKSNTFTPSTSGSSTNSLSKCTTFLLTSLKESKKEPDKDKERKRCRRSKKNKKKVTFKDNFVEVIEVSTLKYLFYPVQRNKCNNKKDTIKCKCIIF